MRTKNLIIGAGPTGLLLGGLFEDSLIVSEDVGGLVNSCEKNGFVFDHGLHIYTPLSEPLSKLMVDANAIFIKERKAYYVPDKLSGKKVTFPVQHHTDELGVEIEPTGQVLNGEENFEDYIVATYGEKFCEAFLRPFNKRVWSADTKLLGSYWVGERVAKPDSKNEVGMHDSFYYVPGVNIVNLLLSRCKAKFYIGSVYSIDKENRTVLIRNGQTTDEIHYERCFCTAPIFTKERHNKVLFVGIGLNKQLPFDDDEMFHWIYCRLQSYVHRISSFSRLYPLAPSGCDILSLEIPYRFESWPTTQENFILRTINRLISSEGSARQMAYELLLDAGVDCVSVDMIDTVWLSTNIGYATQTNYSRLNVLRKKKDFLRFGVFLCGRWGAHAYMNFQHVISDVDAVYRASTLNDKDDYFMMPYCYKDSSGLHKSGPYDAVVNFEEGRYIAHVSSQED